MSVSLLASALLQLMAWQGVVRQRVVERRGSLLPRDGMRSPGKAHSHCTAWFTTTVYLSSAVFGKAWDCKGLAVALYVAWRWEGLHGSAGSWCTATPVMVHVCSLLVPAACLESRQLLQHVTRCLPCPDPAVHYSMACCSNCCA